MSSSIPRKGVIDQLIIGIFILLFGAVWLLHEAGLVQETAWIWPFAFVYFGTFTIVGALYRWRR